MRCKNKMLVFQMLLLWCVDDAFVCRYQKKKYSDLQRKFKSGTRRKKFIKHKKHYKK